MSATATYNESNKHAKKNVDRYRFEYAAMGIGVVLTILIGMRLSK